MSRDAVFGERATISDVIEQQRRETTKALEDLSPSDVLESSLVDLVSKIEERFRLDVPTLDRTAIFELPNQEVEIDVRHDQLRHIPDRSRPFFLKGTAFRIAVPFSGEAVLFKYGTSPYNPPVPAEVEGNRLVLTHETIDPDPAAIKRDFDHRLARIEATLELTKQTAAEWNRQLPGIIRPKIEQRRAKLLRDQTLSLGYPKAPIAAIDNSPLIPPAQAAASVRRYDLFLSHASEDKADIARPLYEALTAQGVSVWFDEAVLTLGDSLRRKIDEGLAICRFGLVILSPSFFAKEWPQKELDGLVARENASGEKAILPIWHKLEARELIQHSATLADRVAAKSAEGIPAVVARILRVLGK